MFAVFALAGTIIVAKTLTAFGVGKLVGVGEKVVTGYAVKEAFTADLHYRAGEGVTTEMVDPRGVLIALDSTTQVGRDVAVMALCHDGLKKYVGSRYGWTKSEGRSVEALLRAPRETLKIILEGKEDAAGNLVLELAPLIDFLETFPVRRTKKA